MTITDFIEKANKKHNGRYDYSKVEYVNNHTKVCIICPEHGEFWQMPYSHLNGNGCPACVGLKKRTTESFIEEARRVHGDKYDYSKSIYVNKRTKLTITCPEHGDFEQCAHNHLQGQGCPQCGKKVAQDRLNVSHNPRKAQDVFQKEIDELFDGKCEVIGNYINNKTYIDLYCHVIGQDGKEHGLFSARPDWLVRGHGCPICGYKKSFGEIEIVNFLKDNYNGTIIERDRDILNGKEIDIYLPDIKLGIEFNGLLWHSEKYRDKTHLIDKLNLVESKDIKLLNIFEDEWKEKRDICQSMILNAIGKSNVIYARKCNIKEVPSKIAKEFIDKNHIQGGIYCKYNIGLFYHDELVSIMTFGNLRKNLGQKKEEGCYEMLRFCNKLGCTVVGGASKLMKYFIKAYKPDSILSYADRRWSNGHLYETLGFNFVKDTKPNYFYISSNGKGRINRFSLRKDILVEKYDCPKDMTEHDFCLQNGYYRVYDCGNKKYIWKKI